MGKLFLVQYEDPKEKEQTSSCNLPLNETERSSALSLGKALASFRIGKIFSSRCIRALHTAQIIGQQQIDAYVLFSHREDVRSEWYQPRLFPNTRCIWIYPEGSITLERREAIGWSVLQEEALKLCEKEIFQNLVEEDVLIVADFPVLDDLRRECLDCKSAFQLWGKDSSLIYCSYSQDEKDWIWEESFPSSETMTSSDG